MSRKPKKRAVRNQIQVHDEDLENVIGRVYETRFQGPKGNRQAIRLAILLVVLIFGSFLFCYDFLHNPITPARYYTEVTGHFSDLWRLLTEGVDENAILSSFCTLLVAAMVGACMAVCGSVCQGIFHTPMASPGMLGIQSGGMVAAVIWLFFFYNTDDVMEFYTYESYNTYLDSLSLYDLYAQQIWMLGGCVIGAVIVIFIATRAGRGKMSTVVLILVGSLSGAFSRLIVSLGQYYFTYVDSNTNRLYALMSVSMGTFANTYKPSHLLMMAIAILPCMIIMLLLAPRLNVLMFGDESARAMGMRVQLFRTVMLLLCIIPCAVILAFCGQISFIGLLIPHFARQMAGSDYQKQLPVSALLGAVVMVSVYGVAKCTGLTTSINLVCGVVGGALTFAIVLYYRRRRNADWA